MRNPGIELLRIICFLCVIGIHTVPVPSIYLNAGNEAGAVSSAIINAIVRPGLPVFFMISGYFLLNAKEMPLRAHFVKRLSSVIIPFVAYGILHVFITKKEISVSDIGFFFEKIIKGTTALDIHFWFVYSICGLYIAAPLIRKTTINLSNKESITGIFSLLAICAYNLYFKEMHKLNSEIRYLIPIPDIGMSALLFVIGGLISKTIDRFSIKHGVSLWMSGILITLISFYLYGNKYNFNTYPESGLGVILASIGMVILFAKISLTGFLSKISCNIAAYTYGAFLIHLCLLRIIRGIPQHSVIENPITFFFIVVPLTAISALLVAFIVDNIVINKITSKIQKWAL